ncbi:hypothetical protein Dda_0369 [Drechslerella dactyloides]|uniref:F-box domain-containing protein n=1 Tax=Drechslerella dactyloides TaxID=74499 RepID=A0AAD6J7S9_DREDA|nr:hypothetical protein Dda_0369 [Drechslerella dactyloides]
MSLDQLPAEILVSIVSDFGLVKADVFRLILTCRVLYQNLRRFLFQQLAYGSLRASEDDTLLPLLDLHGFRSRKQSSKSPGAAHNQDRLLLSLIRDGWIGKDEFAEIRVLRLYSNIEPLNNEETSIVRFLDLLQGRATNITHISLYLLRGSTAPNIGPRSRQHIDRIFELLQALPKSNVQFELVTDIFQCLDLLTASPNLTLHTLFIDASLSNREEIEQWQDGLKQFTTLTHLAYKSMSPWAVASDDQVDDHHLCDDFPNLKIIRLICSPNFTALPRSIHEIHIDIGERDQIIHHCFPLITTLPHLRVLYALNRQNTLPRYHGNPMQTARLPGTTFTSLKTVHAEMPRPDEKLMFFPPGVLETIANCNPTLENIFLPFLSEYDASQLMFSDCTRTLRSLEIQSSICRTITRETSFGVKHLVKLLEGPGVPNLETVKWSIGGKPEMAVTTELIAALYPTQPPTGRSGRRHNLRVLAVESRLPKPQSPYVYSGILNWEELLQHRTALLEACVNEAAADTPFRGNKNMVPPLRDLIKPVSLTVDGTAEHEAAHDLEFPYESRTSVIVHHRGLSEGERAYLQRWRRSGGSIGVTVDGPDEGLVYDFRKSVFEELYFFDLPYMKRFAQGITLR